MPTTCMHCGQQQNTSSPHCIKCGQPLADANPYASPTAINPADTPFYRHPGIDNLAGRWARFVAQFADGLLNLVAVLPGGVIMFVSGGLEGSPEEPGPLFYVGLGITVLGSLMLNIYQWVIISRHGQSIGKQWMNIRIVKYDTRQPPGFVYGVLLRLWVNGILSSLPCGIGLVYTLVDLCFIFRDDRRCVHDLLAQTIVVED